MRRSKIPLSAVVVTKNEEARIAQCLEALSDFDEVVVVDSESRDATCDVAREMGARVENFKWNGAYPKKRQWCLDHLELRYDWVFFVDADEIVTPEVVAEIVALFESGDPKKAGFFVLFAQIVRLTRSSVSGQLNNTRNKVRTVADSLC